jgi:hypothetical protein
MQSGVILSTGNVLQASGPKQYNASDGNASWTEMRLKATLAVLNWLMSSANATVLEFDSFITTFDFDFLFASEEYGNFQCQFFRCFCFLLITTILTKVTTIAVVHLPPISGTIRDFLYNSTCGSVNSQYFGAFNGGSNAANSGYKFQWSNRCNVNFLTPNVPFIS